MKRILFPLFATALVIVFGIAAGGHRKSAAVENCISWDNAIHSSAGDPDPDYGRPAIDRLAGDQPYGQLLGDWVDDNCMRLNEVQVIGTHNSYHIQPRPALLALIASVAPLEALAIEYTHRPLDEQLGDLGIRQVELDVYADPTGGLYAMPVGPIAVQGYPDPFKPEMFAPGLKVLHGPDVDFETTCTTFAICLNTIKAWSDANPGHLPVMIQVEAKDEPLPLPPEFVLPPELPPLAVPVPFGNAALDEIDATIRSVFSEDQLITPDDVRGDRATLEDAVLKDGWPTLNETRGRFLFTLDNEDAKRDLYIAGHPSLQGRVLFTNTPPGSAESAFVKVNEPQGNQTLISQLVAAGYIVRTRADANTLEARFGLTARRDAALASGAQFVSTDYPEPDPDFGAGYFVRIADGTQARCNPVLSPPGCDASRFED